MLNFKHFIQEIFTGEQEIGGVSGRLLGNPGELAHSSSLRQGTIKGFPGGKWFIGCKFGADYEAKSKFGTLKELIVLNIILC